MPRSRLANFGGLSQFRLRSWRDDPAGDPGEAEDVIE